MKGSHQHHNSHQQKQPQNSHILPNNNNSNNNNNNMHIHQNYLHNAFANDKNNNNMEMMGIPQQHPPSSPTNSSSSSMSTSSASSAASANNNNNTFMIDHQNLKHLITQQIQHHHQQQQNQQKQMMLHNNLQRTISHPHHMIMGANNNGHQQHVSFVNTVMENLNNVATLANLNVSPQSGCGDVSTAAAVALHRKLERTQSEPLPQQQVNASRYKTELCRPFEEAGECKYGDKCQFAHGIHELRNLQRHPRYKTELCRTFHSVGYCPYGPRCHFVHNADEVRANAGPVPGVVGPQQPPHNNNHHHHLVSRSTSLQNNSPLLGQPQLPQLGGLIGNIMTPPMSMSTGSDRASPTGSLSLSPTNSMVSFFPETTSPFQNAAHVIGSGATFPYTGTKVSSIILSPPPSPRDLSPSPPTMAATHLMSPLSSSSSTSSVVSCSSANNTVKQSTGQALDMADARLPVFNRLSSTIESAFTTLEI